MTKTLVDLLDERREQAIEDGREFGGYDDMVSYLAALHPDMDPERITQINHGDYQGTLVFVVGGEGYQPWEHWYVTVGYGSCSSCDVWEAITGYQDPKEWDRTTLESVYKLLHDIASGFRRMNSGDEVA